MPGFNEDNAKSYFELLNQRGELSDDELSNAAGGCKKGGRRVVTGGYMCPALVHGSDVSIWVNRELGWTCRICLLPHTKCQCSWDELDPITSDVSWSWNCMYVCNTCAYCSVENGIWYCNNEYANNC